MANPRTNNSNISNKKLKLGSINICGLSERSKLCLNKFIDSDNIDILALQETGTVDPTQLELVNMSAICDTNNAANKGTGLYVNNQHSISKLESLSKQTKHIDSCWGLVVAHKKRYIVGNVYVKLNYKPAITEVLNMLKAAEQMQEKLKASGIILTGDFNARHCSWGDALNNYYGKNLVELLDHSA